MALNVNQKAGLLYMLPVVVGVASWFALLLFLSPPAADPLETLIFLLGENPQMLWFRWFLVLPLLCLLLAAGYFSHVVKQRLLSIMLFLIGIIVSLACWVSFDWWVAVTATLPLAYGYLSVRSHFDGSQRRATDETSSR